MFAFNPLVETAESSANPSRGSVAAARNFVARLGEEARHHRAVNHPYLTRLAAGEVPDIQGALRDFGFQYLAYSRDFIRYLTATIAQLEHNGHRQSLLRNLLEESGNLDAEDARLLPAIGIELEWIQDVPHPELYLRFLDAIGIDAPYRDTHPFADTAVIWRDRFFAICFTGGAAQALGAIGLGTENVVRSIYRPILEAIERHLDISRRDRVFFDLHVCIDDKHGAVLTNIAVDYAVMEENRRWLRKGMLKALSVREAFFDAMEDRADAMTVA